MFCGHWVTEKGARHPEQPYPLSRIEIGFAEDVVGSDLQLQVTM